MLKAVGRLAAEFGLPAELSLDEHMGCGIGVCLTCVVPIKAGDSWEYQRTCTDGPVFDSREVAWEAVE
jgi:dihydroorotate dehydrogenase electron transfer subunit